MSLVRDFTKTSVYRYLVVGFSSFGVEFIVFSLFLYLLKSEAIIANAASILVAFVFNFTLSNFWTFKAGKGNTRKKITRYTTLIIVNYILNNSIFYMLNTVFSVHAVITKFIVTALQVIWSYFIYRSWIFK